MPSAATPPSAMPTMLPAPRPPPLVATALPFGPLLGAAFGAALETAFAAATAAATLPACLVVSVAFLAAVSGCFDPAPPITGRAERAVPARATAAVAADVTAGRIVSEYALVLRVTYGPKRVS